MTLDGIRPDDVYCSNKPDTAKRVTTDEFVYCTGLRQEAQQGFRGDH